MLMYDVSYQNQLFGTYKKLISILQSSPGIHIF
jgi:hypothetical protein